jgi:hypothetical protein
MCELEIVTESVVSVHTWVNSVKIIQIRGKSKTFNRAFDVILDMSGRIGNTTTTKDVKATLRGNCRSIH